uniref:Uncharacterized protein n=1 Tax=Cucumis melo TaxID=3656 RepID=A0A9I9E9A3_CUCME
MDEFLKESRVYVDLGEEEIPIGFVEIMVKQSTIVEEEEENSSKMIYENFINYMTEILSLRLEIIVCTLVEIEFPVSLGLLVKSSRHIQVQKSVVRRLHAIFRSKVFGGRVMWVVLWEIYDKTWLGEGLVSDEFRAHMVVICKGAFTPLRNHLELLIRLIERQMYAFNIHLPLTFPLPLGSTRFDPTL